MNEPELYESGRAGTRDLRRPKKKAQTDPAWAWSHSRLPLSAEEGRAAVRWSLRGRRL